MQTAVADPLVGRVLERRYRLRQRLARGGMSVVYLATDQRLERDVAVKVMNGTLSADPAFTDRFAREARAAARLAHLNVVAVYDQGDDAGHVFLVMELVRGITVRDLITGRGPLPVPLAVSVMEPVLAALSAAHRAGLVHRDVKPENVLLSDDGLVKVADFGLARAIEADPTSTRTGLMMGTVAYCSPEHITNGRADARSDVYAAGIMLYELLTGRVPYVGESAVAVAYQHVHSRVPGPSHLARGVPHQLDDLVRRATDPDPTGRPADAGAFLAELHDLRAALGIPITPLPTDSGARRGGGATRSAAADPTAAFGVSAAPTTAIGHPSPPTHPDTPTIPTVATVATVATGASPSATTASMRAVGRDAAPGPTATTAFAGVTAPPWIAGRGPGTPLPTPTSPSPSPASPLRPGDTWDGRRRRRRRRGVVVLLVVLLVGATLAYSTWWYAAGRWSAVPDVAGQPTAAATSELRAAGFAVPPSAEQVYNETVPAGLVVRTDPDSGNRRVRGGSVALVISRGQERFEVPATAGVSQADATRALSTIPVTLQTVTAPNDTAPAGTALGSDPAVGAEVKRNATVVLTISSGPPILPVPTVTSQSQADAGQALETAGFKVAVGDPQFSDTVPAGSVVSQSPSGGSAVKFSTVTLVLSKGPDVVTVPAITNGTPVGVATSALQAAGLQVKVDKKYGGLLGVVVGMDPPAGQVVRRGSTVTLTAV